MGRLLRLLKHRRWDERDVQRVLPSAALERLRAQVQASELHHGGEIRICVEAGLPLSYLWRRLSARDRAVMLFGKLRVWDTEHNNGVLIYLLLADRDVEIVADRGVANARVPQAEWDRCCAVMQQHFVAGRYADGAVAGIEAVADVLARHPGSGPDFGNELPDAPVVL